jgi:hypothetical protein
LEAIIFLVKVAITLIVNGVKLFHLLVVHSRGPEVLLAFMDVE